MIPFEGRRMAGIERLTITLPSDTAAVVKGTVNGGDYASTGEVVREALRDWKLKRRLRLQELSSMTGGRYAMRPWRLS
jgi:antitoxin ParD1/3/4